MENVTTSPKIPDNDIEAKTIVTFVMPAYNAGKYIVQAIESIENQTIRGGGLCWFVTMAQPTTLWKL